MIVLQNDAKPVLLGQKLPYMRKLTLRLFQNFKAFDGDSTTDDFVEATFAGYLAQDLRDLGRPYKNRNNQGESDTCPHTWRVNAPGPPNDIYGYYVTDANGWLIFFDVRGATPTRMSDVGATYTLVINFLEDTLR